MAENPENDVPNPPVTKPKTRGRPKTIVAENNNPDTVKRAYNRNYYEKRVLKTEERNKELEQQIVDLKEEISMLKEYNKTLNLLVKQFAK